MISRPPEARLQRHGIGPHTVPMDPRNVPLAAGHVSWIFPAILDTAEAARIATTLAEADDTLYRAGQFQGADADASIGGIPLNRFYYQRLGPQPDFTATALMAEGGHGQIETFIGCIPGSGSTATPGPPWRVHAIIDLPCDLDPESWHRHQVLVFEPEPAQTPLDAAHHILAAAVWILNHAHDTPTALRMIDPHRGHEPIPQRRD